LNGIDPKGRLTRLHAEADFDRGTLLEASADGQFGPGAIVSTDSPHSRLDISTTPGSDGPAFHLNIGRFSETRGTRPVVAQFDTGDANVRFVTNQNVRSETSASLRVETKGALFTQGKPAERPILNAASRVAAGLSGHASNIAELLGDQSSSEPLKNF